jgi:hypothetical protein
MINSDNGIVAAMPLLDAIGREYQWPGYQPWKPGVGPQLAVARKSGVEALIAEYRRLRASRPSTDFSPGLLNGLAYELKKLGAP